MKITITPGVLCSLIPSFTLEACEAICNYFEEAGCSEAPSIGDIAISFSEVPLAWVEEDNENISMIITLKNGNALVIN